jgi:hypothetical protein
MSQIPISRTLGRARLTAPVPIPLERLGLTIPRETPAPVEEEPAPVLEYPPTPHPNTRPLLGG